MTKTERTHLRSIATWIIDREEEGAQHLHGQRELIRQLLKRIPKSLPSSPSD
jgi:hypothetical protein